MAYYMPSFLTEPHSGEQKEVYTPQSVSELLAAVSDQKPLEGRSIIASFLRAKRQADKAREDGDLAGVVESSFNPQVTQAVSRSRRKRI